MGNKIELMLEAERRGILPEDKKILLNEARSRGLLKNVNDNSEIQSKPQEPSDRSMLDHVGAFAVGVDRGIHKPFNYIAKGLNRGVQYGLDSITGGEFVKRGQELEKKEKADYEKKYGDSDAAYVGDMVGEGAALALPVSRATNMVAKGVQALPKIGQYAKNASNLKKYIGMAVADGAIGNVASGQMNNSDFTADDIIGDAIVGGGVGGVFGLGTRGLTKGYGWLTTKSPYKAETLTANTRKILKNKILANRLERIAKKNYDVDAMRNKALEFRDIGFSPELNDVADNLFMSEANAVRGIDDINDVIDKNDGVRDTQIKTAFNKIVPDTVNVENVGGDIRHKAKNIVDTKNQKEYGRIQGALNEIAPENVDIVTVGDDIRKQIDTVVTDNNNAIIKRAKPLYDAAKRTDPFYTVDKSVAVDGTPDMRDLDINGYKVDDALNILNPVSDITAKRPITQYIMDFGGIEPGSDAAEQLYKVGIKPGQNAPVGLFRKGGIKRLDSFDDMGKDFSSKFNLKQTDNLGRIDYYEVLDRMVDEANGFGHNRIKDTPQRRDLSLHVQAMGLDPDTITQDDLVSALVQRKKNDYVPNQEGLKNLSEQVQDFKSPDEVLNKTYNKHDLYKKHNLPKLLDHAQPNTQRFDTVYDEQAKFRRIPQDYYEKSFKELPLDEHNLNADVYIHPESVSLKDDRFIQDEIKTIKNSAYDFVDKNAPDDSIEMLLEVRNRLDDRIRTQPDANTKQYMNSRNKINYALGSDALTKKADDFYKIKYDLKESQNKDKFGQIMSVRDANVGAVVQNLMGKGTKANQFYNLTNILKPKTKSEIAASYLRNMMDNHNVDDGFESVYTKTFSTNDLKEKFANLLEPEKYQKLDSLMEGIKNARPDKKKINQIAKIDDANLGRIIPNLMDNSTSPQNLKRIGKVLGLSPKTKKDVIISHLKQVIDNLDTEQSFDTVYNKTFSKPSIKAKIQSFLPENDFKQLSIVMDGLKAIKATKYRLRGANTFNKLQQANVFNDPSSWVNIVKDIKTGGVISAIFKTLGKVIPNVDERKSGQQLYDFFVNPNNLDQSIMVLEELQKAKTAQQASDIFKKYLPEIKKATSGVNRWANTAETEDR